ncbi:CNNM domain-containing protein [Ileibacterium valens]|uniref:CNNM domain-containing protein n=1 Tax=Ileibacterium valens TaxID=1862668 RepID=UPI0034E55C7F
MCGFRNCGTVLNEYKVKKLADENNRQAKKLEKLISDPSRFFSVIQIAITLSGFLGSAFAADNFSGILADWNWNRAPLSCS